MITNGDLGIMQRWSWLICGYYSTFAWGTWRNQSNSQSEYQVSWSKIKPVVLSL